MTADPEKSVPPRSAEYIAQIQALLHDNSATDVDPLTRSHLADKEQHRTLKGKYARTFIWILIGQLFAMNVIFLLAGLGALHYERWTLDMFMSGTLAEVFGVVVIITRNLFPRSHE
jgi:hypothetical protein